jgi:regulatory protein
MPSSSNIGYDACVQDKFYEKTIKRAFNILSAKPRSIAEMRTRLLEKEWATEEIVERVITRLCELEYLDDEKFAVQFANSKLITKQVGASRLRRDLQRKKLSSTVIAQALETVYTEKPEAEMIEKAIAKRVRLKGKPTSREESKKLFDYLLRLGFKYDLVIRKVREAGKADIDSEE